MSHLTWQRLGLLIAVTCTLTWLGTRLAATRGVTPVVVPWTVIAVTAAGAALALSFAWSVRQYKKGSKPDLDPLFAARTAVFTQAAAYSGAMLAGGYGGYALGLAIEWSHQPRREVAITALLAAIGGVVLMVAGWVGERWCRAGGDDDDDDNRNGEPEAA